jgi:hypothetical protein
MKWNFWQIIGSGGRVLLMTCVPNVEFGFYYYNISAHSVMSRNTGMKALRIAELHLKPEIETVFP